MIKMGNLNPCTNLKSVSIIKNLGNDLPITRVSIIRLVLIGLDNSGKTSTALHLLKKPIDDVVPTLGFNSYELNSSLFNQKKNTKIELIDLGGSVKIRSLWEEYYSSAHGFIFLLDSSDSQRLGEIKTELEKLLCNHNVKGKPLLVLLNKMDLDNALDETEICGEIKIEKLANEFKCPTKIEQCSIIDNLYDQKIKKNLNIGIENGFIWLINYISNNWDELNQRVLKEVELKEKELNNRIEYLKEKFRNKTDDKNELNFNKENFKENPFKPIKELVNNLDKKDFLEIDKNEIKRNETAIQNKKNLEEKLIENKKFIKDEKISKEDKISKDEKTSKEDKIFKDEKTSKEDKIFKDEKTSKEEINSKEKNFKFQKLSKDEKIKDNFENENDEKNLKTKSDIKSNKFQTKFFKIKTKISSINEFNKLKKNNELNERIDEKENINGNYSKIEKENSFASNSTDTLSNETVIEVKKK